MRELNISEISAVNGGLYTKAEFQQVYGVPSSVLNAAYDQYVAGVKAAEQSSRTFSLNNHDAFAHTGDLVNPPNPNRYS